jgi:hypothetical protein
MLNYISKVLANLSMHTGKAAIKLEFSETAFRVAKITVGRTKPERTQHS